MALYHCQGWGNGTFSLQRVRTFLPSKEGEKVWWTKQSVLRWAFQVNWFCLIPSGINIFIAAVTAWFLISFLFPVNCSYLNPWSFPFAFPAGGERGNKCEPGFSESIKLGNTILKPWQKGIYRVMQAWGKYWLGGWCRRSTSWWRKLFHLVELCCWLRLNTPRSWKLKSVMVLHQLSICCPELVLLLILCGADWAADPCLAQQVGGAARAGQWAPWAAPALCWRCWGCCQRPVQHLEWPCLHCHSSRWPCWPHLHDCAFSSDMALSEEDKAVSGSIQGNWQMLHFEVTCFWCPNWIACSSNTSKLQNPKSSCILVHLWKWEYWLLLMWQRIEG